MFQLYVRIKEFWDESSKDPNPWYVRIYWLPAARDDMRYGIVGYDGESWITTTRRFGSKRQSLKVAQQLIQIVKERQIKRAKNVKLPALPKEFVLVEMTTGTK